MGDEKGMSKEQKAEALAIAQETANATSQNILTGLGIDMSTPASMIQAQVDFAYLRRSRKWSEKITIAVRILIISGGIGFFLDMAIDGIKAKLGG